MRKKLAALMLTGAIALAPMQPAYALFGVGDVVIDPTNLAQNILTAARTLEMINNQITQLQNEAQMLINQGRNLANLPHSSLARRVYSSSLPLCQHYRTQRDAWLDTRTTKNMGIHLSMKMER